MQLLNMSLSGFTHGFGRKPRTEHKRFADKVKALRESMPGELPKLFSELVSPESLPKTEGTRRRVFDTLSTF